MKLINSHLVPGGAVKIYDDTRSKTAKFEVTLTAEGASELSVLGKLIADLDKISDSITYLRDEMMIEAAKLSLSTKTTGSVSADKETRRRAFIESMKLNKSQVDNQSDEPLKYDD